MTTITFTIVGRVITTWGATQKIDTKSKVRRIRATTLATAKLDFDNHMGGNREKPNIVIAISRILGAPILFSSIV